LFRRLGEIDVNCEDDLKGSIAKTAIGVMFCVDDENKIEKLKFFATFALIDYLNIDSLRGLEKISLFGV
jgi:hypothetical protein